MVKKITVFLIAVLVLLGAASFALGRFFDLDKVLRKVEAVVEQKTGSPFTAKKLSLGFRGGLSLELTGVRFDGRKGAEEPLVAAERVGVRVKFLPLLKKEIEVTDVTLDRPRIAFVRDARGQWNLPQIPAGGGADGGSGGEGAAYLVSQISVRGGEIFWMDVMKPEFSGSVSKIDADLRGLSPEAPAFLKLKAAMPDSKQQNFVWEGSIGPFSGVREPAVDGEFRLGLDGFDIAAVKRRFKNADIPLSDDPLSGFISGTVKGPADPKRMQIEGRLEVARIESKLFRAPVERLKTGWYWTGNTAGLRGASAEWGQKGTLSLDANVTEPLGDSWTDVKLAIRGVDAHDVTPKREGKWEIYGAINADAQLRFASKNAEAVKATLTGAGQFELSNGLLKNVNVLAIVMDKVSSFVRYDIRPNIHPHFQPLLQNRDMALGLVQSRFSIENGNVKVNEIALTSHEFEVRGSGHVSLYGRMHLDCALIISQALTAEILRSVPDFAAITEGGRLVFPFTVVGETKKPQFAIDKEYLTARVVAVKGQQLLQNVLQKGQNTANQAGSTANDLLKNVF